MSNKNILCFTRIVIHNILYIYHRRRIELEDMAKFVPFQIDQGKTASAARGTVELNRLLQIDGGKTASAARILSPNPTRQHLPCLLNSSNSILLLWTRHTVYRCICSNWDRLSLYAEIQNSFGTGDGLWIWIWFESPHFANILWCCLLSLRAWFSNFFKDCF